MDPCPAGTYGDNPALVSAAECTACPAGQYCDREGLDAAPAADVLCAPGFYCTTGSALKYPYTDVPGNYGPCPAGYWCEEGTSDPYANPCLAGTYNPQERATS